MPYSIFFAGGYAIHGSNEISRLGRPASHGCIRLHPGNAAVLFEMVRRSTANTRIVITGGGEELIARSPARAPSDAREPARASRYGRARPPVERYAAPPRAVRPSAGYRTAYEEWDEPRVVRRANRPPHQFEELFR
jgi:hypothetical protein